jgi:hypothetical protein
MCDPPAWTPLRWSLPGSDWALAGLNWIRSFFNNTHAARERQGIYSHGAVASRTAVSGQVGQQEASCHAERPAQTCSQAERARQRSHNAPQQPGAPTGARLKASPCRAGPGRAQQRRAERERQRCGREQQGGRLRAATFCLSWC